MNCQIVHDSLHSRNNWTQSYRLSAGGATVGYGATVMGGPWVGKPTLFEFYVLPQFRSRASTSSRRCCWPAARSASRSRRTTR